MGVLHFRHSGTNLGGLLDHQNVLILSAFSVCLSFRVRIRACSEERPPFTARRGRQKSCTDTVLNQVRQVSQKVRVQPPLSFCYASLWAWVSTSQLSWLEAAVAAVSVTQQLKASGFPKAGSGIPPPPVNTSIILQVDWLAHWIRHENEGGRPVEKRQLVYTLRYTGSLE